MHPAPARSVACAAAVLFLAGCSGTPGDLCDSTDWQPVYLRDGVPFEAIEDAFRAEGWTTHTKPEAAGTSYDPALWASKTEGKKQFNATVAKGASQDSEWRVVWNYTLVSIVLSAKATTDEEPRPTVAAEEPELLARLRALGTEERKPHPWPTHSSSDWNCAQV